MKPLIRNSIFMMFFNVFGRASGFLRYLLLVGLLTEASFSLVSFAFYFGSLCRHFVDGGLDNFVSRDGARDYGKIPSFYINALFLKAVLAVVFCSAAFWYLRDARDKDLFEILIVYIALIGSVMTSFTGVIRSCFTAIERMEFVFYTNLPSRLLSISLLFIALWFGFPLELVVASVSLENVLWFFLLGAISLRYFQLKGTGISFPVIRYMVWESLPLMVYGFFNVLYLSLDVMMIEYLMGLDSVAPYTYASMLLEGVGLLVTSYFVAVYPTLSRLFVSDFDAYRRLFRQSFVALFMFTIPTSVLLGFWSHLWMNIIKDTGPISGEVLSILAINLNLSMMNTLLIIVFTSCNRQRLLVLLTASAVIISFLSNWFMIPWLNQPGAAWASLFSQSCLFIIMSITASRLFHLTYPWQKPLSLFIVAVISAIASKWIPGIPILVEPVLYVAILVGIGYSVGIVTKDDLRKIQQAIRPPKE